MRNYPVLFFLAVAIWSLFYNPGLSLDCTPDSGPICGNSPPNNCNDYCSGTEEIQTTVKSAVIYYQTSNLLRPSESRDYGTGTYLKTAKIFHDETYDSYTCGCCSRCVSGSCCSHDWCSTCNCKDISCQPWQTCPELTDPKSDKKAGCECDPTYCKGWCMDNAPVYDGLASCEAGSINTGDFRDSICEQYLKGTCESGSSGKKAIASLTPSSISFCLGASGSRSACLVEQAKTCNDYSGANCADNGPIYLPQSPTCTTNGGKSGWMVQIPGDVCGSGQSCCIPLESAPDPNLLANPKYTLVPDEHKAPVGTSCYCNYLAIKDYYECADTKIDDSHPCVSGNCAVDFIGGNSYCCPEGSCSHLSDPSIPLLCLEGSGLASCDSYLAPDQAANPSVMCIPNQKEISYGGYQLTCDNGQWRNSQSCGETLFNYPLNSDLKPEVSEKIFTDAKYGYKNSPIAFQVKFDTPKDAIAYVIPKAKSQAEQQIPVKISIMDSEGNDLAEGERKKEVSGDGTKQLKLEELVGTYKILFSGGHKNAQYNISLDCYTPDKTYCDYANPDCSPGSYCVEDSPQNIALSAKKTCQTYTDAKGNTVNMPKDKTQNCYYCCPKGYCAHKVNADLNNALISRIENMAPLKNGEEVKILLKDSRGNELTGNEVNFELGEVSKSICELDVDGTVIISSGLLSANPGISVYNPACKIKISYNSEKKSFWVNIPLDTSSFGSDMDIYPLGSTKDVISPSIKPLAYSLWPVGANKEFLFYDSEGDKISSGISWQILEGESTVCRLAANKDFGIFEGLSEGKCTIIADFNGQTAALEQEIISPSAESNIQVYVEKTINSEEDYTIECYPPGTHKLDSCNWICRDGSWGKGMIGQTCENDCDCNLGSESLEEALKCMPINEGENAGTCCKAGQCAGVNSCVDEGSKKMIGGVMSECTNVNGIGKWERSGIVVRSSYERTVLTANNLPKEVNLEITKNDLSTGKPVIAKVHSFFEKGNYFGNIVITATDADGNEFSLYTGDIAKENMEFTIPQNKLPVAYKAKITTPKKMEDGKYFIYLGSTLVVEVQD